MNTKFINAYIEAMLWSSVDNFGEPLDDNYDKGNIDPNTLLAIEKDCNSFLEQAESTIPHLLDDCTLEDLGHDFWLSRNRHGVRFWDGDYPKDIGNALTDLTAKFKECICYVGDDGIIYLE